MGFLKIHTPEGDFIIYGIDSKGKITVEIDSSGIGSASDTLLVDLTTENVKEAIEYLQKQIKIN